MSACYCYTTGMESVKLPEDGRIKGRHDQGCVEVYVPIPRWLDVLLLRKAKELSVPPKQLIQDGIERVVLHEELQ